MSKVVCIVVIGCTDGGTYKSIERCICNHQDMWGGTGYHEYEYNSEGFISTLITNVDLEGRCADVDTCSKDIVNSISSDDALIMRLGNTNLDVYTIDMSDGCDTPLDIQFLGYMPGSDYDTNDYYCELEDVDMEEDWNGDCPM